MKQNIQTIDKTLPVALTLQPDFQSSSFTVAGQYEEVIPVQADYDTHISRRIVASPKVGHVATMEVPSVLAGRRASVVARLYDLTTGRNMYELLKQKRADERDLKVAKWLGIVETDRCAKHERQLARIKGLV